jgi:hypothetical protein
VEVVIITTTIIIIRVVHLRLTNSTRVHNPIQVLITPRPPHPVVILNQAMTKPNELKHQMMTTIQI